jgi:hypothetical protein
MADRVFDIDDFVVVAPQPPDMVPSLLGGVDRQRQGLAAGQVIRRLIENREWQRTTPFPFHLEPSAVCAGS